MEAGGNAYAFEKVQQPKKTSLLDAYATFENTNEIPIPRNPIEQIIGQDEAVKIAGVAARQKRNLLLVAPPGTGKSLLAQAISYQLPRPTQEVNVLHNPENPERPVVEVKTKESIEAERKLFRQMQGKIVSPKDVPSWVSEDLGFRCRRCAKLSSSRKNACPYCGTDKFRSESTNSPFGDLLAPYVGEQIKQDYIVTTRVNEQGREEVVRYEPQGEQIRVLDQRFMEKLDAIKKKTPRKVLVPLDRKTFVAATGASETELLGDVRHDPYGGHQGLGTPPYQRVVPGSVHEAHEGVLFIDEISTMTFLQRFLLTAMQERKFPIIGHNPHSAGASVKVDGVPCDFILIAASNINDIQYILPPLRSRILGNGYEVLLETNMPDTTTNRAKLAQFVAQEIRKDNKIPHANREAVETIIDEARRRAKIVDNADGALTLRLRELSGIVRLAGDIARISNSETIDKAAVELATKRGKNIEEQLSERYGSLYKAQSGDAGRNDHGVKPREIG